MRTIESVLDFALLLLLIAVATFGLIECSHEPAFAQDVAPLVVPDVQLPASHEILALDSGDRAPRDGMLINDEDLVAWRQRIEQLTFQLAALRELDSRTLALRLDEERARTGAATDRASLRDELWRQRAAELSASLATAQAQAARGPAWYDAPILWTLIGAVLGGALVGLIASAL